MSHHDFLALSKQSFKRLYACVDVVDAYQAELLKLVTETTRQLRGNKKPPTLTTVEDKEASVLPDPDSTLPNDLSEVVYSAAETANARFAKIIAVRAEAHSSLSLPEFVEIFSETWSFVVKCETLCRRMIVGLRGTMVTQVSIISESFSVFRVELRCRFGRQNRFCKLFTNDALLRRLNTSRKNNGRRLKSLQRHKSLSISSSPVRSLTRLNLFSIKHLRRQIRMVNPSNPTEKTKRRILNMSLSRADLISPFRLACVVSSRWPTIFVSL
jgi:hypothetical protein